MSDNLIYLLFSLAIFCDAFMDHLNFRKKRNSGFWSIHTKDVNDGWHWTKKLMWTIIGIALVGISWKLAILAWINLIVHEVMFHKFWKEVDK